MNSFVADYLKIVAQLLESISPEGIEQFADRIWQAREKDGFIYACGNGGSSATASHFIEDLAKGVEFPPGERRFKALALCESVSLLTAYGNDLGYEDIFAEQMANFLQPGDVLITFSGSGNSPNVLRALKMANETGAITLAFGGMGGGKMKGLAQQSIIVPSDNMQQIEDCHLVLSHALYSLLRRRGEAWKGR